jgi:hypothetical protein
MQSDLSARCRLARELIDVPPFPLAPIRLAVERSTQAPPHRKSILAIVVASFSVVAIAAAAEISQQTHVQFNPSGGLIISAGPKTKIASRPIHSSAEIHEAARRLDFPAIVPQGLPEGTKPVRLFASGTSLLAITYDLPGVQRRSHQMLWISIANRATTAASNAPAVLRHRMVRGVSMSVAHWGVGPEDVIVISNGLTDPEFAAIKRAMEQESRDFAR